MKEFFNNALEMAKTIAIWLGVLLVFSSLLLNFWLVGQMQINKDIQKDSGEYLRYRDSIQLELMDRITDKNNTVRK